MDKLTGLLHRALLAARDRLTLIAVGWEGDASLYRPTPPPVQPGAQPDPGYGTLPLPCLIDQCIAPPEGKTRLDPSDRVVMLEQHSVLLTYHGFNRLITEELIGVECVDCGAEHGMPGFRYYHPRRYPGIHPAEMEAIIHTALAEPMQ